MHAFFTAAFEGNRDHIRECINKGVDINATNECDSTALILSSENGQLDVVRDLLAAGADIHHQNNEGNTALHSAANFGHEQIVLILLEAGAMVDLVNQREQTPLMLATRLGNMHVIRALLEKNADVNTRAQNGMTALLCSGVYFEKTTDHERLELIKTLIQAGADPLVNDVSQQSLLHFCARQGWLFCAQFLMDLGLKPDTPDKFGYTALHLSINSGHNEMTLYFLRHGARIIENQNDVTLHTALSCSLTDSEVIAFLIESGIGLNTPPNQDTLLMEAVKRRDPEVVHLVLNTQPPINERNRRGWTALHFVAASGQEVLVEILLEHHADINIRDEQGNTALHFAFQFSAPPQLIQLLLEHRVDFKKENDQHNTALNIAISKGHPQGLARLLPFWNIYLMKKAELFQTLQVSEFRQTETFLEENAWQFSSLDMAEAFCHGKQDVKVLALLIAHGLNPDQTLSNGMTLLEWSTCRQGILLEVAELLLKSGARSNIKTHDGTTLLMALCGKFDAFHDRPVHYSQQQQKAISRMLRDLLTKGSIDLNLKDKELNTALMWAVHHRRIQDIRALLQAEAHPNIQNIAGYSALMHAVNTRHAEKVVRLLLKFDARRELKNRHNQTAYDLAENVGNPTLKKLLAFSPDKVSQDPHIILKEYPVILSFNLPSEELDELNRVNTCWYFHLFDQCRMAYFRKIAFDEYIEKESIKPALCDIRCHFELSLIHPDTVYAGIRVMGITSDRLTLEYVVWSQECQCITARANADVMIYPADPDNRLYILEKIQEQIEGLEKRVF